MKPLNLNRMIAGMAVVLTGGIGLFTLLSWTLDRWELVSLGDDYIPMAPITALLFVLLAAALAIRLWLADRQPLRLATCAGVLVATLVAVSELVRWTWPIDLPWDLWGFGVETGFGVMRIGQMAPLTAVVFMLTILAFAGTASAVHRWVHYLANLAALAGLVLGCIVILAYAAGTPLGYGQDTVPMAWLTATVFLIINAGILAENEGGGLFHAWRTSEAYPDQIRQASRAYRTQLLFVLATVFVVGGLLGFYYLRQERATIRQRVQEQLVAIANLKVGQIKEWWRERLSDVRQVAAMPGLSASIEALARDPAGSAALRSSLSEYLTALEQAYGYRQVILFDHNLTPVLVASGKTAVDNTMPAGLRQQVMGTHEPLMNDLHRTQHGRVHLDFIAPIRTKGDDQFAGAVQLTVDASVLLYPLVKEWPSSSTSGETLLVRPDGAQVLYLNELRHRAGAALQLRLPANSPTLLAARALRSNVTGLLEGTDYRGTPVLGVVRRVTGTPWFMIAKLDQAEAYAAIRNEVVTVLGGVFLIASVVGLLLRSIWQERQRQLAYQQLQLERSSRATSERLAHVMQHAGDVILLFDEHMRIIEANQRVQEIYGRSPEEMTRLSAKDLRSAESADHTQIDFSKILTGQGLTFETTHVRQDGSMFPVEVSARPVVIAGQRHVLSIIRDISLRRMQAEEIARLSRLYYVISQINRILLRVKNRHELFTEVCEVLVNIGGFRIAWIGWLDPVTGMLHPVAVAGDEHAYVEGIRVSVDPTVPEGRGPSGTAFREGRIVVCNNYFNDIATKPWHERAARSGFRSSIALPFQTEGRTVGMLTVYSELIDFFSPREVKLLEETVDNLSFALEIFEREARRVAEETERRKLSLVVEQSPTSIVITDLAGNIEYVNPTFLQVTGYTEAEVRGRNPRVLKSGLTPQATYVDMWGTLSRGEVWRGELSNKKKNGEVYIERAVIAPVADETGRVTHYVALKEDVTKSKQVEDELRVSNERFRALFESNLDGLLITVPTGEIVAANPAACAMLGRSEAEICRLGRNGLIDPADPRIPALLEERRRTGRARGIMTMVRADGTRFEAEVSSAVFGSGSEQRNGMVLRDITDRIKAEQALRESEARFRELFDLESDAILVFTVDTGRIIQANRAAALLYGMPMERLLALKTEEISAEPEATLATLAQFGGGTEKTIRIPLRYHRRSDGTIFPVEINQRLFHRDGQALVVGVIRDITEQMRAQDQMRRFNDELEAKVALRTEQIAAANNEMQALLQSIPDLVMRVNRSGTVLNYQPAKGATPLAGLSEADVVEADSGSAGPLRTLVRTAGEMTRAANAAVVLEHELPLPGGAVAVELRAAPVSQDDFVVFVRDVTARKRFEAEMADMLEKEHQVSEMKTRFISVTSHEFRTPMSAALGSVELLTNHLDRLTPAKRGELLARITQSLLRMTEMLDEILILNRMDANRVEMRLVPVDLLLFVRNLVEEIRLGDRVGHVIELESTGEAAGFVTDTNLLHHILGNILSNAVRYSPAGSRIMVRLAVEAASMRFAVEDQGIGIPAEDLQRIFEPFERGSNVGTIKGTGLGLNIVRRMAEMLRGEVSVRSAPTGSCFTVTLPTQTATPPPS